MTFNIRLNTRADSLNAWPHRVDKVISEIRFHGIQLLGVQEALHNQMEDLWKQLPEFRSVGGGRDDGRSKGEYSAIFYDTTRLEMLQGDMFWLSRTPYIPGSRGWDAAITRIVTWARFRDRLTNRVFFAFNTHFDHQGQEARRESALLVLKKLAEIAGDQPVVFMGDFNSRPYDEPIRILCDPAQPMHLQDSKGRSRTPHYGPTGTFNGFQTRERDDDPIDYIFLRGNWLVQRHATLSQSWQGRFASDHFAVIASVTLP